MAEAQIAENSKMKKKLKEELKDIYEALDIENGVRDLVIRKKRNETVIVHPSEYEGKDTVVLENIENCDIYVPFVMNNFYVKNTYYSRIYCGYVLGTAYIETTSKSCYQVYSTFVKVLKANECNFGIWCRFNPIIEDCIKLKFGPCMFEYKNRLWDKERAGFEMEEDSENSSKWSVVIDNKWSRDEQSPNWSVLNDEEIRYLTQIFLPE